MGILRTLTLGARPLFAVDARTLALFRVLLALCLAIDFASALADFVALFTDQGVLPRTVVTQFWPPSVTNSFYLMSGHAALTDLLLSVHGAAILALLIGYHSRLAAVLCFLFTCSLQTRNFLVLQSSDDLLRLLLFWAIFVPIGGRWSVDAALNETRTPQQIVSIGGLALQCQALFVYFFGALIKTQSAVWISSGTAVAMALADGTYGSDLGRAFLAFPALLKGATFCVVALELLAPFLIWFPFRNLQVRLTTLALLVLMHLAFAVLMHVGIFPLVSLTSLSLFLPSALWDRLAARASARSAAAIRIYYDGACLFCYKTALIFRTFCLPETVPIEKAQHHPDAKRLFEEHNSWVVYDGAGTPFLKWDAVAFVLRQSPIFRPLGWLFERRAMRPLCERLYRLIGDNRGPLGRITAWALKFHRDDGRAGLLGELICGVLLLAVTLYNVSTLRGAEHWVPGRLKSAMIDARFEQKWTMFAPVPRSITGSLVAPATTQSGRVIEIFHGRRRPYSTEPLNRRTMPYSLQKWVKYYERLVEAEYAPLRLHYGRWLCRTVNAGAAPNDLVTGFTLHLLIEQPTLPSPPPREDLVLWKHSCF